MCTPSATFDYPANTFENRTVEEQPVPKSLVRKTVLSFHSNAQIDHLRSIEIDFPWTIDSDTFFADSH